MIYLITEEQDVWDYDGKQSTSITIVTPIRAFTKEEDAIEYCTIHSNCEYKQLPVDDESLS